MKTSLIFTALLALFSLPALAAQQTVSLSVPGMTCAACPLTVKAALTQATTNAGYPSTLKNVPADQE